MTAIQGPVEVDPKDPWATVKSGYDPHKIYTRATNGHDHSELLHVKVSPALVAVMREAKEQVNEYRTLADIVRDALCHRMHEVSTWPDDHINLRPLDIEVRHAEIQAEQALINFEKDVLTDLTSLLEDLIRRRDYDRAMHFIETNDVVESLSEPGQAELSILLHNYVDEIERLQRRTPQPPTTRND